MFSKYVYQLAFSLSLSLSFLSSSYAMKDEEETAKTPPTHVGSKATKKKHPRRNKKKTSLLERTRKPIIISSKGGAPKAKEDKGIVEMSPAAWVLLQTCLDEKIKETLADSSYEQRTFCFQVVRKDWEPHFRWQQALMRESRYPIGYSFTNKKCEGDRIDGIYAVYHKELTITNATKKEKEAREAFAYRFFKGPLDETQLNSGTFYNLMVRAGFTEEDFKKGKHGFQEKVFVKPIVLKNVSLSEGVAEVQDALEITLKKSIEPFVALVFELPPSAGFSVSELLSYNKDQLQRHLFDAFSLLATIIEENERRLYLCFDNDKRNTLDLHGKSYEEALKNVKTFIREQYAHYNEQCIIITGRGNHKNSDGTRGVMFASFPKWMKDTEISSLVERFVPLGEGGYKVYLKKSMECDLTHLKPEEDLYEFARDTLRKVIKTSDLRLRVKTGGKDKAESFGAKLVHSLSLNDSKLFGEISPLSMDFLPGELRLYLRSPQSSGLTASPSDAETEASKTPVVTTPKKLISKTAPQKSRKKKNRAKKPPPKQDKKSLS